MQLNTTSKFRVKVFKTFSVKHTFLTQKKCKLTQNFCKKFWFNHSVLNTYMHIDIICY